MTGTSHAKSHPVQLELGVKTDPIEYRYTFPWLFRLMSEEGVHLAQLGTTFEFYQLPDEFFLELRRQADDCGVQIASIFTAHRELGGFFRDEPGFVAVARRNFERLIQIGRLVGAESVGCNPGAVLRDHMGTKPQGMATYLQNMKELLHFAHENGVSWLTIEPMSCLAEPPTLPEEMRDMAEELTAYHRQHAKTTAKVGYCVDIAHGYADATGKIVHDHLALFQAALPWLYEVHLKNTDAKFHSTFGFTEKERAKGIVDVAEFVRLLEKNADKLPVRRIAGYLEIGGPKLGRDYSDHELEDALRQSLRYLKTQYTPSHSPGHAPTGSVPAKETAKAEHLPEHPHPNNILIAPSMMCADLCYLESHLRQLESAGVHLLHWDIMDAHFAPNLPLGLATLEQLRPKTHLPFDVHLMVDNNDFFIEQVAKIGVQMVSIHAESAVHLDRSLARIRDLGIKAGAAINPATPLSTIEYVLERLDFVLLMTVNPGFAGQKLVPSALRKIEDCRILLERTGRDIPIEVDGNVSFENIPAMVAAGAGILVAGTSSLFSKSGSLRENAAATQRCLAEGLKMRKSVRHKHKESSR